MSPTPQRHSRSCSEPHSQLNLLALLQTVFESRIDIVFADGYLMPRALLSQAVAGRVNAGKVWCITGIKDGHRSLIERLNPSWGISSHQCAVSVYSIDASISSATRTSLAPTLGGLPWGRSLVEMRIRGRSVGRCDVKLDCG
jgi:hypothetical protein